MKKAIYGIAGACLVLILSSCTKGIWNQRITGNAVQTTDTRKFAEYEKVVLSGSLDIIIDQNGTNDVVIQGEENIIPYISTEVIGQKMYIKVREGYSIKPTTDLVITVGVDEINEIELSGSGSITSSSMEEENLDVELSGSGDIDLSGLEFTKVDALISGSGKVELDGVAPEIDLKVTGSGELKASGLVGSDVDADISGSGKIYCHSDSLLSVEITGSGSIYYSGSSTITQRITGSGSLIQL